MNHPDSTVAASPGSHWPSLLVVLLIALAARGLYLLQAAEYPNFAIPYAGLDAEMYHQLAVRVASGDLALGHDVYHYSPLFAYWLGSLYALFGDSPWTPRLANLVCGLGTVGLIYLITWRLFRSRPAALLAALGAALYGPYLVFDASALKASLGLLLSALAFWLALRALERQTWLAWLAAGAAFGLALGVSPQLAPVMALLLLWLVLGRAGAGAAGDWRSRFAAALLLGLGAAVTVAPFALRNYLVAGEAVLLTAHGGIHLYIGNHPGASGAYSRVKGVRNNPQGHFADAKRVAERAQGRTLTHSEASSYWKGQVIDFAREQPGDCLRLLGRKALLALNRYELPNNESYQYLSQRSPFLDLFPGSGLLLPLGLTGLLLGWPRRRELAPLYLFFTGSLLALVATLVTWRYRLPLTLALWPAAGYALAQGGAWLQQRRYRPLAGMAGLLVLSWGLSRLPLITAEAQARDLRLAEQKMRASASEFELRRQLASGKPDETKAVRLWLALASQREQQQDWEGAAAVLREALAAHPHERRLQGLLANLLMRFGEHDQAVTLQREMSPSRFGRPPGPGAFGSPPWQGKPGGRRLPGLTPSPRPLPLSPGKGTEQ